MKKISKTYIVLVVFILGLTIVLSLFLLSREQAFTLKENVSSKKAITLKDAVTISNEKAMQWSEDAELVYVTSTDAGDNPSSFSGKDGTRNSWNLIYTGKDKDKQFNIYVINGWVEAENEIVTPVYESIDINEEVTFDSDSAALLAEEENIYPTNESEGWAVGYHFVLQFMKQDNEDIPILAMLVYGTSDKGKFSYIVIDAKTETVISIMEQEGYDKDGKAIWKEREM
jgi:hypothetical protein